jgi:hypothetical protein
MSGNKETSHKEKKIFVNVRLLPKVSPEMWPPETLLAGQSWYFFLKDKSCIYVNIQKIVERLLYKRTFMYVSVTTPNL